MKPPSEFSSRRLGRVVVRLVPAGRRDWVEAAWAEAGEVPAGLPRLAWRAGGVQVLVREVLMVRRVSRWLLFAAAVAVVARLAWPGSRSGFATTVARVDVITIVLVLAGLPLLVGWFLGPVSDGWLAPFLRVGGYAAALGLIVAKASVSRVTNPPGAGPARSFDWFAQIMFLLVMAGYLTAILAVTARRSRIAPATLAIGTGAGVMLGAVMYAVAPLGLSKDATEPWLRGSAADPVVVLAWILLLGAPAAAATVAGRRSRRSGRPEQISIRQCGAAGFLAAGTGALIVTVLGTSTIALMPGAGVQHWLYPGQHLLPAAARGHELAAAATVGGYGLILLAFPVIGLIQGLFSALAIVEPAGRAADGDSPGGGGAPAPGPVPGPPDGGRRTGTGPDPGWLAADLSAP